MRHAGALFLTTFCALALCPSVLAQPAGSGALEVDQALTAIRPQAIRAHMGFLADDLLEGRRTGTRGYDLAAKYVVAQFEALGLEPAGTDGYFQPVPLVRMMTVEPECSLAFLRDGRKTALRYGLDYFTGSVTQDSNVTAPVVFAGFGVAAPELGYDDYAGIEVRGKIVAVLSGAPPSFPHNQRAYYSDPAAKVKNLLARGAVGYLGIFTPSLEQAFPWKHALKEAGLASLTWADETGRPHLMRPGAAILSWQGVDDLLAGTSHTREEIFKNAETGRPHSFDLPVQASLRTTGRLERIESPNVAAVLRGSDPCRPDCATSAPSSRSTSI